MPTKRCLNMFTEIHICAIMFYVPKIALHASEHVTIPNLIHIKCLWCHIDSVYWSTRICAAECDTGCFAEWSYSSGILYFHQLNQLHRPHKSLSRHIKCILMTFKYYRNIIKCFFFLQKKIVDFFFFFFFNYLYFLFIFGHFWNYFVIVEFIEVVEKHN